MDNELRTLEKLRPDEVFVLLDVLHTSLVLNYLLLKGIIDLLQLLLKLTALTVYLLLVSEYSIFLMTVVFLIVIFFIMGLLLVIVIADPLSLVVSSRHRLTSASASLFSHLEFRRLTKASLIVKVSITSLMLDATSPATSTSLKAGFIVDKTQPRICEIIVPRTLASPSC